MNTFYLTMFAIVVAGVLFANGIEALYSSFRGGSDS